MGGRDDKDPEESDIDDDGTAVLLICAPATLLQHQRLEAAASERDWLLSTTYATIGTAAT
eukprot:CAMPEP_0171798410 /NCGR_PEP_ID=MMETSP0991-20121206/70544_1 /TAXON_ID=483369 /ORGANISM="non described non described, Strain CCMP2098" /LENGTH=59 /DNA_ID=CAMNT_0012409677 /DNA_START=117 /DNA_END=292 /DNA_ORIENTATION=-